MEIGDKAVGYLGGETIELELMDGWACGTPFLKFKILTGPHKDREIWMDEDTVSVYSGRVMHSDGFGLGCDHTEDEDVSYCDTPLGGDVIPELAGMTIFNCILSGLGEVKDENPA